MRGKITKGDILLILFTVVLCGVWFAFPFLFSGGKLSVTVYQSGEKLYEKNLSDISDAERLEVGGCELLIEKDGVTFLHSECEDKLCEKRGKLTMSGDSMACVPERVTVVISGEKSVFDAISY